MVFTGVVPAVTLTLVPTTIPLLDVFGCATMLDGTMFDGGDWFRADKSDCVRLCC